MKFRASFLVACAGLLGCCAHGQSPDPLFVGGAGGSIRTVHGRPEIRGQLGACYLKDALGLDPTQTSKIATILTNRWVAIYALGEAPPRGAISLVWQRTADQMRVLLTPQQRMEFNLMRADRGGALFGLSPEEQLDRLDGLVHLAPDQKPAALAIYVAGTENLMEHRPPAQATQAREFRVSMEQDLRALLTPEQQKIWDATPRAKGGGLRVAAENRMSDRLLAQLDAMVRLTPKQKAAARQIYQDAVAELMKLPKAGRRAEMPKMRQMADTKIRELLRSEQRQDWDRALDVSGRAAT